MSHFNHLHVPDHWEMYWSKYPEGYTILEALLNWVTQVDMLTDNVNDWNIYLDKFVQTFDKNLQKTVLAILEDWKNSGILFDLLDKVYAGLRHSFHYEEITTETLTGAGGKYMVTKIPPTDKKGNPIYLEKTYANGEYSHGLEIARDNATRNRSSLTVNASTFSTSTGTPIGVHIQNGIVHKGKNESTGWTLGYNRSTQLLDMYPPNVDGQTLVTTYGVTDSWSAFFPIIQNHVNTDPSVWGSIPNVSQPNPRQVIAQQDDKTVLIFTFRGREDDHTGYTYLDMQPILQSFNVKMAYCLDGGGSTQTVKDNVLLNPPIDGGYSNERPVMDFISVRKPSNKAYESFYRTIGELSLIIQKLNGRAISKYGDDIPGRLTYKDHFYITTDKAMYSKNAEGTTKRMIGMYNKDSEERLYTGNIDTPMTLQSSNNILVTLGNNPESYRMNLTETTAWKDVPLSTGLSHLSNRKLQYKKMNAFETRIRGAVKVGTTHAQENQVLGNLPVECSPIQPMVIPVSVLSGGREHNDVVINPDGTITLRFPVTTPNAETAIEIETIINKEV